MATTQEQNKFRNTFNKFLTDANITDPQKHRDILKYLSDATDSGLATPDLLGKYTSFRENRLKKLRSEGLADQSGQPIFKTNALGKQVQATGKDLFVGGQYRPDLGVQGVAQAKQQQLAQMSQQVAADTKRLEGARRVLADDTIGGNARLLGAGVQAIGSGFLTGLRTTTGIAAPTLDELRSQLVRGDLGSLSAETALGEAVKPAATGGFSFGQGLGATLGGTIGSTAGGAALSATTLGATRLAPWLIPLIAAGASFAGGDVANRLSEAAMRRTYGDQYDEVLRTIQQAQEESDGAALGGQLGNVLLQGAPVLASGIGGRQVFGAFGKGVLGGQAVRVTGSAEQLGAGAASMALADAAVLPQAAAGASKFDDLISNFLTKYGATATSAAERNTAYKVFEPLAMRELPGAGFLEQTGNRLSTIGKRIGQFSDFARDTPGVSEYLADAIGEQAVNFGQAAADYRRQYDEAKRTGAKPPSTFEALTNLAFGSLFIGNNKVTNVIDSTARAVGTGALDVAARVPVLEGAIGKMRENYTASQVGVMKAFMDSNNKRAILGKTRTDHEVESGVRSRVGVARPTSAGLSRLAPDEVAYSLGDGTALVYNQSAGTTRTVPHAEVFGGIDDAGTVEAGTTMANALAGIPTVKAQTGLKGFLNKEADVVMQVGDNKQQVIGPVDTGHVIVRETPMVDGEAGVTPIYSIMRVADLEGENQQVAAKLLGDSGIQISTEPTTTTAPDGSVVQKDLFTIAAEQQFLTEDLAEYDTKTATSVRKEFPTIVQFDDGVQLRGRVLGIEANGDIKFQPMSLNMMVMRVPGVNILSGPTGKSTVTTALQPVSIKDLVDEVSLSASMRPTQTQRFNVLIEDADGLSERGLQTLSTDGESHAVMLTPEQLARIPELRNQIKDAVANARTTTSSPQAIDRVRSSAVAQARTTLLGDGGIPSATNDYTLGSLIQVKTPDGNKRGIVLDNTTFGPSVILDDSDGKPVVIQESQILAGESTPRPERASTTATTRGPEPTRNPDEEGSVYSIATTYRNKALRLEFLTQRVEAMRDASASELATELFGMDMDAGRVVGTRPQVTDRYTTLAKSFQTARDNATDPSVKAYYQGLMDTLYDMNVKVRDLEFISGRDLARERRAATAAAEAEARAAGVTPAIVIPTITGTADNVYDNYKQQPTVQTKAEFLVNEIDDIFEKSSTDGEVNEADRVAIASDLFGMQTSEKDGVTRVVGAVNHFVNRYNAMLRAITLYGDRATTPAEFKARATDALAKLDKMKSAVVGNVPFISRNELKAETEAATETGTTTGTPETPVSLPTTISVNLIKDVKSIDRKYKARFIQGIINSLTGDDGFTLSPLEAAQKIFGLTVDNGRVVGDELNIFNAAQSLKDIVTAYEKSRAASSEFKDDAPRIISMLESIEVAVTGLPRVTQQELTAERGARGDVASAERATGQEEAIRNSEQARAERRVSVQQAQAIQGLVRTVRNADGVVVPVIRESRNAAGVVTTRNIAQAVIRKVASRDAATLKLDDFTREEQRVIEALGMPAFTETEWWRNAFQGTMYINDRNGVLRSAVQQLVDLAVDHNRNRRGQPLMLASVPDGLLDANQLRALNQSAFINADGSIDLSGIVIHGSTERGMRFGVLNQVASDEETLLPPSVGSDVMDIALEAVSTISWDTGAVSTFTVDKPKNKGEFESIVKRLISRSKDNNKSGEKAKAIAELFDTLSHAAVKRRVQLMMEAAEKGYFTTRSAGAERTLSPTRGQLLQKIEFDSYLEGELRPLYDSLRRKLNLPGNTDVKTYLTTRGADYQAKQQKVAAAIVEIIDEQLENFYTERFPAFANFEAIPDIANTNGMFVQIYDPDKQVAASVVMAFKSADVSTMIHEIAHAFFEALPTDMQKDLSSALGHSLRVPTLTHASVLTYEAQEKFAYGLEMALANFRIPTDWRGSNAGRVTEGASQQLTAVLNGVAEAVRSSYDILTQHNMMKVNEAGKYTGKEWQIPYTSKPVDGVLQNPNGRVYLWKGAPIILHDGTYAKVAQQFGTTRNGQREVNIVDADGVPSRIRVGEIKAIGGPAIGLEPTAMSVLSNWIGERRSTDLKVRLGLEDSTPAMRAKYIQRDPNNGRIFVSRRNIGQATGDITNEDIQLLLNAIGLPRVKAIQLQAIRERVGMDELKRLVASQDKIARAFDRNRPGIINFEDNALRALTREYASAVLYSRMYDQVQQGNTAAVRGMRGYENPRNYGGRDAFNRAHQAVMEIIFANREAMQSAERQVNAIANEGQNQNWRIKERNGKPMYDPRTGELVIEKIQGAVGRKTVTGEYRVNLKTGAVIIPQGAQPFVASEQRWIETDVQFPNSVPGGKLTDINTRAKDALERIGLTGVNSFRATSPEFFIARALVEKNKAMFLGNVPAQPATVLSQVSDVTSMMQQAAQEQGVRNQPLAEDADTNARDLYTKDIQTSVGTSPNITDKPLYQMTEDEYNDSVFQLQTRSYPKRQINVPARFIRFGMPDKDANGNYIPSTNWVKLDSKGRPTKEKGISVYRAWKDPVTDKYVLESPKGPNLGTQGELIGRIEDGLKIYEFAGETKGNVGADREHTVLPKTARLVGEIAPNDVVTEEDPWWTLAGTNLSESETPNWDRVKPLPSQAVAIYAAQKAGLPVNQEALKRWETSRQWDILTESEGRAYIDMSLATDMDLYSVEARIRAMSRLDNGFPERYAQGLTYSLNSPVVATNNPDSVFQVDITDPINLGNTNLGVSMAFNSASSLFKYGSSNEYVARLRQLDNVTKDITNNTFDDVKATGGYDLTASIAAGDIKPHYAGSVTVKEDSFRGVLARAAYMARKMAQPNVHITSDAGKQEFGVSADGASVVPSLTFPINSKVSDAITLRAFAESMPSVLNGAIYNSTEGTLTVYAVPEKFMMRAEAKEWTKNAKDAAREFFFTTDDGAVKEPKYAEGRLKLWNLGSSEFGAQGRFIPYDTVLDIVSTVSPNDSVLDQTAKVTESTQRRLRGDVQDALTFVFGKDVKLPADAKFRREFIPAPVQQQMANHYGIMPVDGFKTDKNVIPAYKALQSELDRQFKALKLRIDFMPESFNEQMEPSGYSDQYQGDTTKGARDVASGHLYIYPTTPETFGDNKEVLDVHPLYEDSPYKTTNGRTLKWNDVLRAVHDAISHGVYAVNLSPSGQDMAYVTHAMITQDPMAVWALANETRMQNMWKSTNDTVYTSSGQPYTVADMPPAKLEYKFSLPVYESVYTGVSSVDDKLRAFGTQLGDYAGTLSLTAGKGEQTFYGVGNNRSAFADGALVQIKDPSMKGKAVFDLKNGTVRTSEDMPIYLVDDATPMASTAPSTPTPAPTTPTPTSAMGEALRTATTRPTTPTTPVTPTPTPTPTPATPAAPAVVVSARPTRQEPGALRFLYMVNQLLKLGASGDASPVLMQNFPLANILENPEMFIRQLGLQAQVIFNPNTGFHLKDGRIINADGMRGRKLFHETLTKEVRNRNTYEMAKNSGLSLAAADADKLLEEARLKDPNATWDNVDDLGYNTDISVDGEFMKHLPGQGQSERFYAMSKDLVKMRQFDDMVHHLIALGYNPTAWVDAEGNYIDSPFNRALKDISHLLNVIAGDIKVHDIDETDESIMRLGKFLLYSPRWLSSRLLLDDFGRFMFKGVAKAFGTKGEAYAKKVLELNGMTPERLKGRDNRVGAMHARLLNKSWLLWLGLLGLIYGVKATNPRTMEVTVDKFGARLKVGDYSFRAPGAVMTHIELSTSLGQAILEWQAQKGATTDKPLYALVGEKLNSVLLSRSSPVLGLAGSIVTGRDTQGAPAFVTDEAVDVFWKQVIGPELERMGVKGLTDMKINKAIAERMLWWWARDAMEMYADQRKFGVKTSEALLKAAGVAAISSQGGRAMYVPKELDFERKANERLQAPITTGTELFTGVEATPIVTNFYDPISGTNYTDEVAQPFFGATGTDFEDMDILPRDTGF
jgi:hypothetical protein